MAHLTPGDVVDGRYKIERLLGVGGMGSVFAAREQSSGRLVAVKILNDLLRRHPTVSKRFLREARVARSLGTPHAVKVEAAGHLADETPYMVMEFLDGISLADLLVREGGVLSVERVLYLADQVAAALQDAHDRGILHRDLKPENVFIQQTPIGEMVKVVDFGICMVVEDEISKITATGTTVGTPQYMPVEQLQGARDLDGRVDVYSLGVMLYEVLAGTRPFEGHTYEELVRNIAKASSRPLAGLRADLPTGLCKVVSQAMARNRDDRFPSMATLRQALLPYWSGYRPDFASILPAPSSPLGREAPSERPGPRPSPESFTIPQDHSQRGRTNTPHSSHRMPWTVAVALSTAGIAILASMTAVGAWMYGQKQEHPVVPPTRPSALPNPSSLTDASVDK